MNWLKRVLLRGWMEGRLDDELRDHIERQMAEYRAAGMAEGEARRRAQLAFGGIEQIKELCRDARGTRWVEELVQDVGYACRLLRRSPGFTCVAIVCLALGIGANTAVFTVFSALLLRPLPYADPERLFAVFETNVKQAGSLSTVSPADFLDWREQARTFQSFAGYVQWNPNLTGVERAEQLVGHRASGSLFQVLGADPIVGRTLTPSDETARARVVVLSYGLWQRLFKGDPNCLGRGMLLNGETYSVIGIMPQQFQFPSRESEFWVPLVLDPSRNDRGEHSLWVIARLNAGVSSEQGQAELATLTTRVEANRGWSAEIMTLRDAIVGARSQRTLWLLLFAVGLVLLTACGNLANLLLARGCARERELVVRAALGASRRRLVAQLLTESLVLGLAGGAVGATVALWNRGALVAMLPAESSFRWAEPTTDWRVMAFALGLSVAAALVFGALPALRASRVNLTPSQASHRVAPTRLRGALLSVQTATAVILLAGTGLLVQSFGRLWRVDAGFSADHVLAARINLPSQYGEQRWIEFYEQVLARLSSVRGVQAAGAVTYLPLAGGGSRGYISIEGRSDLHADPTNRPEAERLIVSPGFFRALQIAPVEGRLFTAEDARGAPFTVIVNRAFASRYWGNESPIGRRIKRGIPQASFPWLTVVGVVADIKQQGLDQRVGPTIYLPYPQMPESGMTLVVRGSDARALAESIRSVVHSVDPLQPVGWARTLEDIVLGSLAPYWLPALWMTLFAALALLLAALGVYGVVSYAVAQRRHEFGIRVVLGATRGDLLRLAIRQGIRPTAIGGVVGLCVASVLSGQMTSLVAVSPTDPPTFAAALILLLLVAIAASYAPARKIARQEPASALRCD